MRVHVHDVLRERNGRRTDVLVVVEEHAHALATGVRDPVAEGRRAEHGAADHLDVVLRLEGVESGLDHREPHAEAARDLRTREFAGEVQVLQRELHHQVVRQARLGERRRRVRMRQDGGGVGEFNGHVGRVDPDDLRRTPLPLGDCRPGSLTRAMRALRRRAVACGDGT